MSFNKDNNHILQNKSIAIYGIGKTGISIIDYAIKSKAKKIYFDDDNIDNINKIKKQYEQYIDSDQIQYINFSKEDKHDAEYEFDIIFISPGISKKHNIYDISQNHNIKILSDIELFLIDFKNNPRNINKKIIAVTGTNGKTTTCQMIYNILKTNDLKASLVGNIGNPILNSQQQENDYFIIEISSFQLDLIDSEAKEYFDVGILLNISEDHLDRYDDFNQYIKSKEKIINLSKKTLICANNIYSANLFNKYSKTNSRIGGKINGKITALLNSDNIKNIIKDHNNHANNYFIYENYPKQNKIKIIFNNQDFTINPLLQGEHNYENIIASFYLCKMITKLPIENIIKSINLFSPLDHRMELFYSKNNINIYNDSKATNSDATAQALKNQNNIFWIAGGIFKEKNLNNLDAILKNIRQAFFYGQDKGLFVKYITESKIENSIEEFTDYENLQEVIKYVIKQIIQIRKQNIDEEINIIFSPACSSFDQFKNFEERGDYFKKEMTKQINNLFIK